jgi:uncharacterized membrane protein
MENVQAVVLGAATITMGLVAGVFVLYAHTIMPGLAKTDDRTFVAAFQAIDRAIINPWFMTFGFIGAPVLTAISAGLFLEDSGFHDPGFVLTAGALVLYAVTFAVTIGINVPLNDAIKAAGDADEIDAAGVRAAFTEDVWVQWNRLRVITTTGAFGVLCWALLVHGANNIH